MKPKIRCLLERLGEFRATPDALSDSADLHAAGLSSYGTVELMVALEEEFGIEFPDTLLTRATFASIDAMAAAVAGLLAQTALAHQDAA